MWDCVKRGRRKQRANCRRWGCLNSALSSAPAPNPYSSGARAGGQPEAEDSGQQERAAQSGGEGGGADPAYRVL